MSYTVQRRLLQVGLGDMFSSDGHQHRLVVSPCLESFVASFATRLSSAIQLLPTCMSFAKY